MIKRNEHVDLEAVAEAQAFQRIGSRAVEQAQAESREQGVPNVYSFRGRIYYELPSGELSLEDPFVGNT